MGKFFTIICLSWALMAMKPVHSTLEITAKENADKTQQIEFKVKTIGAIVINDGRDDKGALTVPWQLSISNPKGVSFAKTEFTDTDYDGKLPGFSINTAKPATSKAWSFDYKVIAFICTKMKEQCYREVHKGTFDGT